MSTSAYGIEAIWEGQQWLLNGFDKLTRAIGRAAAGTFSTAKGEVAIRAGDIPPTGPALDRRREWLLTAALAAPKSTPRRVLLPSHPEDDSSRHRIPKWFAAAADNGRLQREGQQVEPSAPTPRLRTLWVGRRNPTLATCNAWTDGSFRRLAVFGCLITAGETDAGPAIAQGSKTLGN